MNDGDEIAFCGKSLEVDTAGDGTGISAFNDISEGKNVELKLYRAWSDTVVD